MNNEQAKRLNDTQYAEGRTDLWRATSELKTEGLWEQHMR